MQAAKQLHDTIHEPLAGVSVTYLPKRNSLLMLKLGLESEIKKEPSSIESFAPSENRVTLKLKLEKS